MSDEPNETEAAPQPDRFPRPPLDGAVAWLNVAAPITLAQLRGKVVILDFWTYGCVNCMHVLRDLKTLEQRFPDELVVIGVHSPKFTNEKDTDNLRRILVRYEIEHPVANDADHAHLAALRRAGVADARHHRSRPATSSAPRWARATSTGFISAIRTVVRVFDEARRDQSRAAAARARARGVTPIGRCCIPARCWPTSSAAGSSSPTPTTTASSSRRSTGELIETIGSGPAGRQRRHLLAGALLSAAGPGARLPTTICTSPTPRTTRSAPSISRRARSTRWRAPASRGRGAARAARRMRIDLNSPWDLALKPGILIVAMAGPHQIWVDRPAARPGLSRTPAPARRRAGRRRERGGVRAAVGPGARRQHALRRRRRSQHHPRRRAAAGQHGDHARRRRPVRVRRRGRQGRRARACSIRSASPCTTAACSSPTPTTTRSRCSIRRPATVTTLRPTGHSHEPGGLSIAGNTLFVADTNNHAIRTVDLATRQV